MVNFNGTPVPIDYDVIAFFKSLIDKNGFLHLGESLKAQLMSSIFSSRPDQYGWTSFITWRPGEL